MEQHGFHPVRSPRRLPMATAYNYSRTALAVVIAFLVGLSFAYLFRS